MQPISPWIENIFILEGSTLLMKPKLLTMRLR